MSLVRLPLLPAIKRKLTRSKDAKADVADAALKAKRPGVLARYKTTCAACRYVAKDPKHLDVHHVDDDHQNNDDANLAAACHTCHPYQHIGEVSRRPEAFAESMGRKTLLAWIPEVSAADMNLLQRAIGAALQDEEAKDEAQQILEILLDRSEATKEMYGTWHAADFAAAMAQLTHEQYAARADALDGLRLMFSEGLLKRLGQEFMSDYPSLSVSNWPQVAQGVLGSNRKVV